MGLYLNPGNEAYKISRYDDIYIDKSDMIDFVNSRIGKRKRYLCVSRPRRFGKSVTAEMLSAYYDLSVDSSTLFSDLKIAKCESYHKHLNRYHVYNDDTKAVSIPNEEIRLEFVRACKTGAHFDLVERWVSI